MYHFCMYFRIKHSSHFFHQLTRKSKSFTFQENYQQENQHMVLKSSSKNVDAYRSK